MQLYAKTFHSKASLKLKKDKKSGPLDHLSELFRTSSKNKLNDLFTKNKLNDESEDVKELLSVPSA